MKKYECECGRLFDNLQSFNGHKGHCEKHIINKYGRNRYEELCAVQSYKHSTMSKRRSELCKENKKLELEKWVLEQHRCEKCSKVMVEKFGSGRFCSKHCANSRTHSEEQKRKISESVSQTKNNRYVRKYCSTCGKKLYSKNKSGYCSRCIRVAPDRLNIRIEAGKKSAAKRKNQSTQNCWKSRNLQSYPEQFWQTVLNNNGIVYQGPNVAVRKQDGKHNYFLDFLIVKNNVKIDLEIDGKQHNYEEHVLSDSVRDEYLKNLGYVVYRIKWNEINSENGKSQMKYKIEQFLNFLNCA